MCLSSTIVYLRPQVMRHLSLFACCSQPFLFSTTKFSDGFKKSGNRHTNNHLRRKRPRFSDKHAAFSGINFFRGASASTDSNCRIRKGAGPMLEFENSALGKKLLQHRFCSCYEICYSISKRF